MKLLSVFFSACSLFLQWHAYGCSCGVYDETFFETFISKEDSAIQKEYVIMAAIKLDDYHHGMHVRVMDIIRKKAMEDINEEDTVIAWGGECRQSTDDIIIGDTTILILYRTDLSQNILFPPDHPDHTDIEQEEDLMTPFCGVYKLEFRDGKVFGNITEHYVEMDYSRFTEAIQEKRIPLGIEAPKDASIAIFPNPANDQINIRFPENTVSYTAAYFLDTSGKMYPAYLCYSKQKCALSTKSLSNGLYSLVLISESKTVTKQVLIRR